MPVTQTNYWTLETVKTAVSGESIIKGNNEIPDHEAILFQRDNYFEIIFPFSHWLIRGSHKLSAIQECQYCICVLVAPF